MKRFCEKLISVILSAALLAVPIYGFAEESEINYQTNVNNYCDFEGSANDYELSGAGIGVKDTGAAKENNKAVYYRTKGTGAAFMGKSYTNELEHGLYKFGFDYYSGTGTSIVELRLLNEKCTGITDTSNSYYYERFTTEKVIEGYRRSTWVYDSSLDYPYQEKKWYRAETYIDTINNELIFCVDGNIVMQAELDERFRNFHGVSMRFLQGAEDTFSYVDNVEFKKITELGDQLINPVYFEANAPEGIIGNNFTTDNPPEFSLRLNNRCDKALSAKMSYKVLTNNGEVLETNEKDPEAISFDANGEILKDFGLKGTYYGRLNLEFTFDINGRKYVETVPYAMINHTKDMPKNQNFGINFGRGEYFTDVELCNIAGIGAARVSATLWQEVEKQKGVLVFPEEYNRKLDVLKDNNIFLLDLFANGNLKVYPDANITNPGDAYLFPTTEEGLNGLEHYMEELAKFARGRIGAIEVWNEYNNMSGPYKLQYQYFANLHKPIWEGVKRGDPSLKVSGIDTDTWGVLIHRELEQVLDLMNGEQMFDNISVHPYHMTQGKPEVGGSVVEVIDETERQLEKHGYDKNMEFHLSEIGWSDYRSGSPEKQAVYIVRNQAFCNSVKKEARVYHYCFHNYAIFNSRTNPTEATFGLTEDYSTEGTKVPYLGKESLVAAGYYNNLMAEKKSLVSINKDLGYNDEELFAYKVKTRDDKGLLMLGTVDETNKTISLRLGCDMVTVGDTYGNETELHGIDGCYTFSLAADEITYIKGDFDSVEKCEETFSLNESEVTLPIDYDFDVIVSTPQGFNGKAFASAQNIELKNTEAIIENGKATISAKSLSDMKDVAHINVTVTDDSGNIFYQKKLPVLYSTSAKVRSVTWRPEGNRTDLWKISFDIQNIRGDSPITGEIKTENNEVYKLPTIAPGEVRRVFVPVKKIDTSEQLGKFNAMINLSTTDNIPININTTLTGAIKANIKPVIDGKISQGEWDVGMLKLKVNREEQVYGNKSAWSGPDDASMEVYAKYDNDNFYLATVVKDDVYRQINPIDKMWNGDSLQVLIGFNKDITGTQYGVGLVEGKQVGIYRNMQEENFGGWEGKDAQAVFTDGQAAIERNGEYTVYEMSFPWSKIKLDPVNIIPGQQIYFSVLYNDDDGNDRENWIEYANNCIGSGADNNSDAVEAILLP